MTKRFTSILSTFILILVLSLSCKKQDKPTTLSSDRNFLTTAEAKAWYLQSTNQKLSSNSRSISTKTWLSPFVPSWESANKGEDKNYFVIDCPIQFEKDPGFLVNSSSINDINSYTRLLILKHKKTGLMRSALMHIFSNVRNNATAITYNDQGKNFSGYIFFTQLNGQFINGWEYEDGKIIRSAKPETPKIISGSNLSIIRDPIGEECTSVTINWYERICSYQNNVQTSCTEWEYIGSTTQTYCTQTGGGGGVQDQYTEIQDDANLDGELTICTKSFSFQKYIETSEGVGGWQIAAVKNVHMNIIDLETDEVVPLHLPIIYFGLPVIRSNGEFYSTSTAGSIAADAVEYAEQKVMEYYHSKGGSLDVVGMSLYYRKKIDEYMRTKGGSAALSPGYNLTNIPVTNAVYSGILGLDCL